jgi:FimV-like protein
MEVEEVSDLMQEAEFWMLLNDPERAIDMLEPCLHVDHPVSPVPWIYLLDLYRVTGRQGDYQALAARVKKTFNTSAPAWGDNEAEASARSLRDYPHVVQMIEDLWESDDIIPYLEGLLFDEREGERDGFDLAVYREIIHLIGVARDPETPRRRDQLSFDDPQPRLISQKVGMPSAKPGRAAAPLISEEEADIFDRATSQQVTARQVSAKAAVPKMASAEMALEESPAPGASSAEIPAKIQPEEKIEPVTALPPLPAVAQPAPAAAESRNAEPPMPAEEVAGVVQGSVASATATSAAVMPGPAAVKAEDAERVADMARKLDLVLAYQEIGENVGARVLLEEVIQGGSPLQVEKAKAMLKKLLKEIDWQ